MDRFVTRRSVIQVGSLAGLGLGLPELLCSRAEEAPARSTFGAAKQVIMLYLHGGHPQQETFDPKPNGPAEVRGEFGAISTDLAGVAFSELLPKMATMMSKLSIVRSMAHGNPNHVQASLPANTGHAHPPGIKKGDFPPSATDFPPFGAVLDHLRPAGKLPTWVRLGPLMRRGNGTVLHGQLPGLLGSRHTSFVVDQKMRDAEVEIEALRPAASGSAIRLSDRRNLQAEFNQQADALARLGEARDINAYYQKAFDLLTSTEARRAFRLRDEPPAVRARYGDTEFGQRCLLARRLAEAGVPMVNVSYCHTPSGSWDTHSQNFKKMKKSLAPTLDQSLSALLVDLDQRGMLDETLVVVNAEFGRTPKINGNAGRDHWPYVYSLVLAGAGVSPGTVYGKSDASAAYPATAPHDPKDFAATLYHLLGVPSDTVIYDSLRRPHRLIIGQPIAPLLA